MTLNTGYLRASHDIKTKIHTLVDLHILIPPPPHNPIFYSMSSSDIEYEVEPTSMEPRLTGVVKWFNNKSGFGFITVCQDGHPLHSKDIFCYYKSLRVVNLQFRYLVQGEYVDFTLVKAAVEPHEYQAVDVTGVKCGPLMCETRNMHTDIYNVKKGPGQGPYAHSHSHSHQQQYTKRPIQSSNEAYTSFPASSPKGTGLRPPFRDPLGSNTKYAPVSTASHIDANSTFGSKKRPNTKSSSTDADGFIKVDRNHRKKTIVVV